MVLGFVGKGNGRGAVVVLAVMVLVTGCNTVIATPYGNPSLAGTWTLVAADRELPNGTRLHDYGGEVA